MSLNLDTGTTFVVASNGIGKTSLVEAARWALFGTAPSSGSPVRVGADQAVAVVELVLPTDQVLTIERVAGAKRVRPASGKPTIHLDGALIDEDAFNALLRQVYGTEPDFLARLTMPAASRDQESPRGLGLEDHLGRYFGVEGLQRAVELLDAEIKSTEKQIRQLKNANAASAHRLADLAKASAAAAESTKLAAIRHKAADDVLKQTDKQLRAERERSEWQSRYDRWVKESTDVAAEVALTLNHDVRLLDIETTLESRSEEFSQTVQAARVEIAVRESRAEGIRANQERLEDSHDKDCPVCRRPLDGDTVALANQTSNDELHALSMEIEAFRTEISNALDQRQHLLSVLQKWRQIASPGTEPALPDSPSASPADMGLAQASLDQTLEELITARAEQTNTVRQLDEARVADDAMKQLHMLFGNEASLRVALQTTEATLDELLAQTIQPLASEVDQRWKTLFPDRGNITTHSDGSITRNINGHNLPYDSFSTGESMGATIVLKLLVAQMATLADFCWFDEPLEHLDPDVRRQVANILARASDGAGQLRQILVTTYEEPLARRIHERSPEQVHLIDVRQAPAARVAPTRPAV
ncbi:AAA family ATPase [Williamsia maris]|uniref:AAA family ATPase n=1 Tax=Williamsia maris TaxID=72806 RepID=UPI0020A5C9F6|nr:AAA family ATPase [Williamsia maris]